MPVYPKFNDDDLNNIRLQISELYEKKQDKFELPIFPKFNDDDINGIRIRIDEL